MKRTEEQLIESLRNMPVDISLQESLANVERLQIQRRSMTFSAMIIGLIMLLSMGFYLHERFFVQHQNQITKMKHVMITKHEKINPVIPPPDMIVKKMKISPKRVVSLHYTSLPIIMADEAIQTDLSINIPTFENIGSIVGNGDKVLAIDNSEKKETCLTVSCEAGDFRNIFCSSPIPSPVRVTLSNGNLVYDIDHMGQKKECGPFLPVSVKGKSSDLLLWYLIDDVDEKIQSHILQAWNSTNVLYSTLNAENVTTLEVPTGKVLWKSVSIYTPDGTESQIPVRWKLKDSGITNIELEMQHAATQEIRVFKNDGSMERYLHIVK